MPKTALPMAVNVPVLSPCLVCRRRLRVHGKPVFDTCLCLSRGRSATVATLATTAFVFACLALLVAKTPRR